MRKGIEWVLKNRTSYEVAKALEINNRTVNRYQNGTSEIGKMAFETAEKLYNYYLRERMEMNIESLETAIKEFNEWNRAARIYLDTSDGVFETSVYHNDVQMEANFSTDNYVAVYSKSEIDTDNGNVGKNRKAYILDYARLLLDGVEPMQAKYDLADKHGNIF